jgi:anti-sigma factor RsiW
MLQPEIRCIEFVESVTDWMEGALDDDTRVELEEHLALCVHCVAYVDQLRLTSAVLREAPSRSSTPPAAARAALLDAFRVSRRS